MKRKRWPGTWVSALPLRCGWGDVLRPTGGGPEQFPFAEGRWRLLNICNSYVFAAVIKHHDKKQLKEELTLALCSRELDAGNHGDKSRTLRDHISTTHRKKRV